MIPRLAPASMVPLSVFGFSTPFKFVSAKSKQRLPNHHYIPAFIKLVASPDVRRFGPRRVNTFVKMVLRPESGSHSSIWV